MTTMENIGKYKLELEEQKENVFVTQLREEDEEDIQVRKYPIVKETSGKLLDTGLNTFQSTLLLKKQVEVEKVQEDLEVKRKQFADRMAACELKEEELKKKQFQIRERVGKFEKFIKENESKRRRAIQKYQTELKLKEQKTSEQYLLSNELDILKAKKERLKRKLTKYSVYEQFLLKVLDIVPEDYLETSDSMIMGIMMRFKTLSATNQTLVQMLTDRADKVESSQQKISDMNQSHTQNLVLINSELASLQETLEETMQRNAELDQHLVIKEATIRQQSAVLGRIKLAINNLAEKCQRLVLIPVEHQDFDTKLGIIQEHINESNDIILLARPTEGTPSVDNPAVAGSPSILKKESRLQKLRPQESSLKSAGAKKSGHMGLRFAADVKS